MSRILDTARRVIVIESEALERARERLDERFEQAVEQVVACRGRTVVVGMGKSGQICRKLAATLSSTGTASFFLHAAEAAHGDLGMLARGDVCIAVSNSGATEELLTLVPAIKRLGLPLIALTGNLASPLAQAADIVLDIGVEREACPMNLAPTASTAATLAVGDALAVAVLEAKGFSERDFAVLHPGGALGKQLRRVSELMHTGTQVPLVREGTPIEEAIAAMTEGGLGTVGVVETGGRLTGVVTDGDLRRAVMRHDSLRGLTVDAAMTASPKTVQAEGLAAEALALMERHAITSLFILDPEGTPRGIIHLHDLLRAGIA